jgi:hypothetical protein
MGNSLELKCPSCGDMGEKPVSQTHRDIRHIPFIGADGLSGRFRRRRCSACKQSFQTVELCEDDFTLLVERYKLADRLVYRINGSIAEVNDPEWRLEAVAGLRLIYAVFGEKFLKSWDDIYPISEQEAGFIVYRVNEALASLEATEQEAVRKRFQLAPQNHHSAAQSVDEKIFETAMRKLKHASRSRKLRFFIDHQHKRMPV